MTLTTKALLAAGTALLLAGPAAAEIKIPGKTLSLTKLAANIEAALDPVTVGWAYSIAKDGKPVAAKGGGVARTKLDGTRAHGPSVRQNIASVSKTVTAVATLQLLAKLKLSPDIKITKYLPADWQLGPNMSDVSFTDLLGHTSGIVSTPFNSVDLLDYDAVQGWVAKRTTKRPYVGGMRPAKYDNMNFALLRVLIPAMWAATGADLKMEAIDMYDQLPIVPLGDGLLADWNAYNYIGYVQKNVLGPIGVQGALCSDTSATQTLYYTPTGNQAGQKSFGNNDWTRACGSGGWYLSANDLTNLMVHIRHTEKLLPAEYRDQMFKRLFGVRAFATTGGTGYTKDGVVGAGNGAGLRACTMSLPNGVEVSAVENSATVLPLDVCATLNNAYKAAFI